MHNLRHRYVWVGVLERFEESLRLLRTLLPTYFGGVHVAQANREHLTSPGLTLRPSLVLTLIDTLALVLPLATITISLTTQP